MTKADDDNAVFFGFDSFIDVPARGEVGDYDQAFYILGDIA